MNKLISSIMLAAFVLSSTIQADESTIVRVSEDQSYEEDVDGDQLTSIKSIKLSIKPSVEDKDGKPLQMPGNPAGSYFSKQDEVFHKTGFSRGWEVTSVEWSPTELAHPDAYFEDAKLERHGYQYGRLQPIYSGARFFLTIPSLPYRMGAHPPTEKIYELGQFRPGDDAPPYIAKLPKSRRGAIWQGIISTGLVFIIP